MTFRDPPLKNSIQNSKKLTVPKNILFKSRVHIILHEAAISLQCKQKHIYMKICPIMVKTLIYPRFCIKIGSIANCHPGLPSYFCQLSNQVNLKSAFSKFGNDIIFSTQRSTTST